MELASMLAGERFSDRPASVCPIIGAILRAYNDNTDRRGRQELYRFAADSVGTRADFSVQHRRAALAIAWAHERYEQRQRIFHRPPERPQPDHGPDEIAFYLLGSLERRGLRRPHRAGWATGSHVALVSLLDGLIEIGTEVPSQPLVRDLVEHAPQPVEDSGGDEQLIVTELGQSGPEAGLEASAPVLYECTPTLGQRVEDHAAVALRTRPLDQAGQFQPFQHLSRARPAELSGLGEFAQRQPSMLPQREEKAVLRVAELAGPTRFASAHPANRRHRALERSAHLLGAVALGALAGAASSRFL
jgi:hypothetical protein